MQGIIFIRITTVEKKNPNNILEYSGPDNYNILLFPMHFMAIE